MLSVAQNPKADSTAWRGLASARFGRTSVARLFALGSCALILWLLAAVASLTWSSQLDTTTGLLQREATLVSRLAQSNITLIDRSLANVAEDISVLIGDNQPRRERRLDAIVETGTWNVPLIEWTVLLNTEGRVVARSTSSPYSTNTQLDAENGLLDVFAMVGEATSTAVPSAVEGINAIGAAGTIGAAVARSVSNVLPNNAPAIAVSRQIITRSRDRYILVAIVDPGMLSRSLDSIVGRDVGSAAVIDSANSILAATSHFTEDVAYFAPTAADGDLPFSADDLGAAGFNTDIERLLSGADIPFGLSTIGDTGLNTLIVGNGERLDGAWIEWAFLLGLGGFTSIAATFGFLMNDRRHSRRLATSETELAQLATTDDVTGVANRAYFQLRLGDAIATAVRYNRPVGVLILDLDRFNEVNDAFGHHFGDDVLRMVAQRLRNCVRQSDTVARIGGDEFGVIVSELSDAQDASNLAHKIIEALSEPFEHDGKTLQTCACVGVVVAPADGDDPDELLKRADSALYRAKELGTSGIHLFDPARDEEARNRRHIDMKMRDGLVRNEFYQEFQPKFRGHTRELCGVEALARWRDAEGNQISPGIFIPVAEASGLIHELGLWVLKSACNQQVEWAQNGYPGIAMAVNISARQFRHGNLAKLVGEVIEETGIDPTMLQIEITESTLMQDIDQAEEQLRGLADLGVSIAVDDFGTGYSSLAYLKRFPVTALKIDRSFVKDILHDPDDLAIVQAIITMGKSLGLEIIAEGVETDGQLNLLSSLDCDIIQGFLLGRPMPASSMVNILSSRRAAAE